MRHLKIYRDPKPIFGSKHGYLVAKFGKEKLCIHVQHTPLSPHRSLGRIMLEHFELKNGRFIKTGSQWSDEVLLGYYISSDNEPYTKREPDEFWRAIIADLSAPGPRAEDGVFAEGINT